LSVKSRQHNNIVNYIRNLLKQEVCRSINSIVRTHKPKEIVIEKLDFSNTNLSKSMNRILRNCGMSIVKQKMGQIEQELGIVITYVNPAYSSKVCIRCGYVDEKNRPSQKVFKCRLCGLRLHADVKAAREHLLRSSYSGTKDNPYGVHKSKQSVLKHIVKTMFERLQGDQNSVVSDLSLLLENKYYSGYCCNLSDKTISDGKFKGSCRKKKTG
jgi:putative transposase